MPIYKKGSKWRVVIFHKGSRMDWIVEGGKADAEAFEARKRVEMEKAGGFPETRIAPRFADFCAQRYTPHALATLKAATWRNRGYVIESLILFFGDDKLTEITTPRVDSYQKKRLGDGLEPSTVNDEVKVLRAILNHALYLHVPAPSLVVKDLPVRKKKRIRYWTTEQVSALLSTLATLYPDLYWVTMFLLETGCRKGEALALEFENVDLDRAIIRIHPNEEWQPKDEEPREIPIVRSSPLFSWFTDEATSGRRFVFVSERRDDAGMHTPFAFWPQRRFDIARKATGFVANCKKCRAVPIPAWMKVQEEVGFACREHGIVGGPHTTRHTFASHFLATQPDLYLLGKILGHSHERVTKLYAHLLPDHLERARGAVSFAAPFGVAEMRARTRWGGQGPGKD